MSKKGKILLIVAEIIIVIMIIITIIKILDLYEIKSKIAEYIEEKKLEYIEDIDYDIKIYDAATPIPGGWSSSNTYYLINIDKKINYKIYHYWNQQNGDKYTITKIKISKEEIDRLIKYVEETDETTTIEDMVYMHKCMVIEYKGKTVTIK